jgi:ribonuclease P protein component
VLVASPSQQPDVRIAVLAGRSVGKAVVRNRAKRLLRAALQPYLAYVVPERDILLIARSRMAGATFQQTQTALLTLLRRAGLLVEPNDRQS